MSDVRALLKAKRQEARVNHPFATYTSSGQLRCLACGTVVKHASSWEGHIGSKSHRMNAVRLRGEEQKRAVVSDEVKAEKRKAEGDGASEVDLKRRRTDIEDEESKPEVNNTPHSSNGFPGDFFSDPSRALPPPISDDEEEDQQPIPPSQPPLQATDAIDLDWQIFQQTVLNAPDKHETYERATVFAEPVLAPDVPDGFPITQNGEPNQAEPEPEFTEEQLRKRKDQEERELIMDRLMDEERAQEEADTKVMILKNRLEALRKQRGQRRSTKESGK
ncbi:hypothetical protein PHLCEN_2v5105 [Hermanssonia centrifuga]|uniref:Uncharacterized protein n=1 Tax=Hermanssonia centrifuga TaxID=98765 RepID=A0A2R6PC30_9APHY|nr:hypothetical protein PHLCEN_2v5105 [Hermanssonia centrifuga]